MEMGAENDKIIQEKYEKLLAELNSNDIDKAKFDILDFIKFWNKDKITNDFYYSAIYKDLTKNIVQFFINNGFEFKGQQDWNTLDFFSTSDFVRLFEKSKDKLDIFIQEKMLDKMFEKNAYADLINIAKFVDAETFNKIQDAILKQSNLKVVYEFMKNNTDRVDLKKFEIKANSSYSRNNNFKKPEKLREIKVLKDKINNLYAELKNKKSAENETLDLQKY